MFKDKLRERADIERQRREDNERKYMAEENGTPYRVSIELRGKLNTAAVMVTPIRDEDGDVMYCDAEIIEITREFCIADHHIDKFEEMAIDLWKEDHPDD